MEEILKGCYDIQRCMQRVFLNKSGPRDLVQICSTLLKAKELQDLVLPSENEMNPLLLQFSRDLSQDLTSMAKEVLAAIVEHPPLSINDGKFIRTGYDLLSFFFIW